MNLPTLNTHRKVSGHEDGVEVVQPDPASPEKGTRICGGTPFSGPWRTTLPWMFMGNVGPTWGTTHWLFCATDIFLKVGPKKEELKMVFSPCPWFV